MDTKRIEKNGKGIEARRDDVAAQLKAARASLETERSALAGGKGDVDKLTLAQAKSTALEGVLGDVNAALQENRAALAVALENEAKTPIMASCVALAAECCASAENVISARETALADIEAAARRFREAVLNHSLNRLAFAEAASALAPNIAGFERNAGEAEFNLLAELEGAGADLSGVRVDLNAPIAPAPGWTPVLGNNRFDFAALDGWATGYAGALQMAIDTLGRVEIAARQEAEALADAA